MPALTADRIDGILWISGNVDRSMEKDLVTAVEEYAKSASAPVLDMSDVPYFASSAAKAMILVAQEFDSKDKKIKIRSSPSVQQTLNLLGAKAWIEIETCAKPNEKPEGATKPVNKRASGPNPIPSRAHVHEGSVDSYRPSVHITKSTEPAPLPLPPKRPSSSGIGQAVSAIGQAQGDSDMAAAAARAGQFLVEEDVEVPDGLDILRTLIVMGTYCFHMTGSSQEVTGRVVEHVSGSWILVDSRGSKRMINLDHVAYIDNLVT